MQLNSARVECFKNAFAWLDASDQNAYTQKKVLLGNCSFAQLSHVFPRHSGLASGNTAKATSCA